MDRVVKLDRANLELLDLLQEDGRANFVDLADEVDRAESTVRERIGRLEEDGVLEGYRAIVDYRRAGFGVRALVQACFQRGDVPDLVRGLKGIPFVTSACITTGERPLVLETWTRDLGQLDALLERQLPGLPINHVEASLELRSLVGPRGLPLKHLREASPLVHDRRKRFGLGEPRNDGFEPLGSPRGEPRPR